MFDLPQNHAYTLNDFIRIASLGAAYLETLAQAIRDNATQGTLNALIVHADQNWQQILEGKNS